MHMVDHALASVLEAGMSRHNANFIAKASELTPGRGWGAAPFAGGWAICHGAGSPISKATGVGVSEVASAEVLDAVEAFYRDRELPVRLEVCPLAQDPLAQLMVQRRYVFEAFIATHWREVEPAHSEASPGVTIEAVTETTLPEFAQAMHDGFNEGRPPLPVFIGMPETGFVTPGQSSFLARLDGKPAGGAAMAIVPTARGPLACFFGGATVPACRRRGVQSALLRARLAAAAERGCALAVIQCRPGTASERNIARSGFSAAYTKAVLAAP